MLHYDGKDWIFRDECVCPNVPRIINDGVCKRCNKRVYKER